MLVALMWGRLFDLMRQEELAGALRKASSEDVMGPPWKIVRIVTRLNIGGPAVHVALLSTRLDPKQFSTCLIVGEPDAREGDLSTLVEGRRCRLIRVKGLRRSIQPWADTVSLLQLLRVLWIECPHIVHTHMAKAGALGRLAGVLYNRIGPGRRPGAKAVLVHTFHGHVLEGYFSATTTRFFMTIERWLASRTDWLIAVSPAIRNDLLKKGIGRQEQWVIIPLGIDLSPLAELPPTNGFQAANVGFVGRLVPVKNPGLFLEAVNRLIRQIPNRPISATIVGDGPLREGLVQRTNRLGLQDRVQFVGWKRDISSIYENLHIACLTSWNEGTPVSLIEAMAAGRVVVATDVGGVRDVLGASPKTGERIAPGTFEVTERGLLVRPGDADGLVEALRVVITNDGLYHRLASAGRAYVLQHFNDKRLLEDMTALYQTIQVQARREI